MDRFTRETTLSIKLFCLSNQLASALKGKNSLLRRKFFPHGEGLFSEGEVNRQSYKLNTTGNMYKFPTSHFHKYMFGSNALTFSRGIEIIVHI